jgi:hypothetical protein
MPAAITDPTVLDETGENAVRRIFSGFLALPSRLRFAMLWGAFTATSMTRFKRDQGRHVILDLY